VNQKIFPPVILPNAGDWHQWRPEYWIPFLVTPSVEID
jgi:hypothetical protein